MEDEDEVEDQENEVEDERDGEECRVVSSKHTMCMRHGGDGMTCTRHLEPMSCATLS